MVAIDTLLQERYRIVRQLGQGGMGAVYEAIDERLTKPVAIKEILLELENSEDERQKEIIKKAFQREAANLVKARHAAVPDVTDFFSEQDRRYLVMEYIEGDDLARMLEKRRKPFTLLEVLPWINQLLEALNYLHSLVPPVIHRDIKPQNLKLNEWNKVKLLDFGIAKSTDKTTTLTQNTFLGATLSYSPIEQLMRVINPAFRELIFLKYPEKAERVLAQDTDGRSDLFALGATFYTLLTNRKPADATERALKIWEDGTDKLIHPRTFNPEIPEPVAQWLLKALAFDQENRFADAQEMQNGLQKALSEIKSEEDISDAETIVNTAATPSSFENEKTETDGEILIETSPPVTEIANVQNLDSQSENESFTKPDTFSTDEISSTDYKLTQTDPSVAKLEQTKPEINQGNESFSNNFQNTNQKRDDDKSVPPKPILPISNNLKYILALPVIGITLFAVLFISGYSFISLINFAKSFGESEPQSESKVPAEPIPAVAGNTNLISTKSDNTTNLNNSSNSNTNQTTLTAKPTVEPKKQVPTKTSKPTVKMTPKPVATPKPKVKSTPKPAPKKKKTPRPKKKKVTLDDLINDN